MGKILVADGSVNYVRIYEALNDCFGTGYTGWMRAKWMPKSKLFSVWFPKLAKCIDGKYVSASFGCVNILSEDGIPLLLTMKRIMAELSRIMRTTEDLNYRFLFLQKSQMMVHMFSREFFFLMMYNPLTCTPSISVLPKVFVCQDTQWSV